VSSPAPIPVILDVDTGIDDSLALLYACASPEARIVAVTCCAGNVEAAQVATNTLAVLELAGRPDIEVALGRETPLVRPLETTPETHGPRGVGYAELPPPSRPLSDRHAVDLIIDEARRAPGEILLVTLGPLTNLALALEQEPRLPSLLRGWVMMGGAFGAAGNTTPTTEWNVHVDPDAAKMCFGAWEAAVGAGSAKPALVLGLDVTEQARILPEHVTALARRAGSSPRPDADESAGSVASNPVIRFVADALRFYFEFHERYDGFYGAFIHDPFAVAVALDRSLVTAEAMTVDVELAGTLTMGQTVADRRHHWDRPRNADVALSGDAATFIDRLIERIGGLAATR
jgi:purine nucleosidase